MSFLQNAAILKMYPRRNATQFPRGRLLGENARPWTRNDRVPSNSIHCGHDGGAFGILRLVLDGVFMKVTVEKVSNGFILIILKTGESSFKEPYEKACYVFSDWALLNAFLKEFFND